MLQQKIASEQFPLKNIHVLIVEDDEDTSTLFILILENSGAKVTTSVFLKEALEKAQKLAPDVIVSDMKLPDGTGADLLSGIRKSPQESLKNVPIIVVTGVTSLEERSTEQSMQEMGFQSFLAKPIDPDQLVEVIRSLLSSRGD